MPWTEPCGHSHIQGIVSLLSVDCWYILDCLMALTGNSFSFVIRQRTLLLHCHNFIGNRHLWPRVSIHKKHWIVEKFCNLYFCLLIENLWLGFWNLFADRLQPFSCNICKSLIIWVSDFAPSRYDYYSFSVIPAMGELVAGDRESYRYLVESIRRFPAQVMSLHFCFLIYFTSYACPIKLFRDATK